MDDDEHLFLFVTFYTIVYKRVSHRARLKVEGCDMYVCRNKGEGECPETMNIHTYTTLRDGAYIVSILLCLVSLLVNMNGHETGNDGSLQKVLLSQDESHSNRETRLILFSCALILGCSFLPNLIVETAQVKTAADANDAFLLERYLFTLSYIAPNLIALCGISSDHKHTAILLLASISVFIVTFAYVTTRMLEQSSYKNIWTRDVITINFSMIYAHVAFYSFSDMVLLNRAFGLFVFIVRMYFFPKYLMKINFENILYSNDTDKWKEGIVLYICISNIVASFMLLSVALVFGSLRHEASMYSVKALMFMLITLQATFSSILNTVPCVNLAVSKANSSSLKWFIRQLCHEIRTPLSITQLALENVKEMIVEDSSKIPKCQLINELLEESLEAMDVSVDLLNETLRMDKIESGSFTCEKTQESLGLYIKKAAYLFHGKCVLKNIDLNYDVCQDAKILQTMVSIDLSKMEQVLRNFLSNALKFTPEGGSVTVRAHTLYKGGERRDIKVQPLDVEMGEELPCDNFVRVEVVDTGIGISRENIDKLFQQSTQIDAYRTQGGGGSGFGLLIAKKIVEMHGGEIGVTSQGLSQGSCFYFEIPLLKSTSFEVHTIRDEPVPIEETRGVEMTQLCKGGETKQLVLIVEDTVACAKMLARCINKYNLDAVCVYNGQEAVDEVKKDISKYAIILMDNLMPAMNGMDATETIRGLGYEKPIIGVTGCVMEEDVQRFMEKGVNEVIQKPVRNDVLKELLIRHELMSIS